MLSFVIALLVGYVGATSVGLPGMIGMITCGVFGFITGLVVHTPSRLRLGAALLVAVPEFMGALTLSAWLRPHRELEVTLVVAVLFLHFYLGRFGPPGVSAGVLLFAGYLSGMLAPVPLAQMGWVAVFGTMTALCLFGARALLCRPNPRQDLRWAQRAFAAQVRATASAALRLLESDDTHRPVSVLRRAEFRLSEIVLSIDARLGQPASAHQTQAEQLHQHLFDTELALRSVTSATRELADTELPETLRQSLGDALRLVRDAPLEDTVAFRRVAALVHREAEQQQGVRPLNEPRVAATVHGAADAVVDLAEAVEAWARLGERMPNSDADVPFTAAVTLDGNRPEGAKAAAQRVAQRNGSRHGRPGRFSPSPITRTALQAVVAVAVALPIGDALNPARFYWSAIGVIVVLAGTSTTGQRLKKTAHRVVGTILGAVLGIGFAQLLGTSHPVASIAVIVVALAVGSYAMGSVYAVWVTCLVTALVQLYKLSGGNMEELMLYRLGENALGAVLAVCSAALILPIRTRAIVWEALRSHLEALDTLVSQAARRWTDPSAPVRLRNDARAVDAALFQLADVVTPVVRSPLTGGRGQLGDLLSTASSATHHARLLSRQADADIVVDDPLRREIQQVVGTFSDSVRAITLRLAGRQDTVYVRVAPAVHSLIRRLASLPSEHAERICGTLTELHRIDDSLAHVAETLGMRSYAAPLPTTADARNGQEPAHADAYDHQASATRARHVFH